MKFRILHEGSGPSGSARMRIRLEQKKMTFAQADVLLYFLRKLEGVTAAKVHEDSCDAVICYTGGRDSLIRAVQHFHYETTEVPEQELKNSGRALSHAYREKLILKLTKRVIFKAFMPLILRRTRLFKVKKM